MKLLEYEAKQMLAKHGAAVPDGQLIRTDSEKLTLSWPLVIKAQIPKGGRGKAGGILAVEDEPGFIAARQKLLGQTILGCEVTSLWAEEKLAIDRELYLSLVIDRTDGMAVWLAHNHGGTDVEQAGAPWRFAAMDMPDDAIAQRLRQYFDLPLTLQQNLYQLMKQLYAAFIEEDVLLLEINPLVVTTRGTLVCADAKMELDDAAAFRHPDWDYQSKHTLGQFVILSQEGTVACMANGAGLAMATVDSIKAAGAEPANFLDVGGGTSTASMVAAFERINALPKVRAVVVNIFGGITRCDDVAEAIIAACQACPGLAPLCIRLTGTNEAAGNALLLKAGIATLPTLADCVKQAMREVRRV